MKSKFPFGKKEKDLSHLDPFAKAIIEQTDADTKKRSTERTKKIKEEVDNIRKENALKMGEEAFQELPKNVEKLSDPESASYIEWQTAMNRILSTLPTLHDAVAALVESVPGLPGGTLSVPNASWNKLHTDTLDITPNVSYQVAMDDHGHIKPSASIKKPNPDNVTVVEPIPPDVLYYFNESLKVWAEQQGHTLNQEEDGSFTITNNETGEQLNKAAFDKLKKDPGNGLESWLCDRFAFIAEDIETAGVAPRR